MSAGIYAINGTLNYSLNLEKKLKRRPNAVIIEILENATLQDLQKCLDKHLGIIREEVERTPELPLKYSWKNKITNETFHSIYSELPNIKELQPLDNWYEI